MGLAELQDRRKVEDVEYHELGNLFGLIHFGQQPGCCRKGCKKVAMLRSPDVPASHQPVKVAEPHGRTDRPVKPHPPRRPSSRPSDNTLFQLALRNRVGRAAPLLGLRVPELNLGRKIQCGKCALVGCDDSDRNRSRESTYKSRTMLRPEWLGHHGDHSHARLAS